MVQMLLFGGLWVIGNLFRTRRIRLESTEHVLKAMEAEQDRLTKEAVQDERARIARDFPGIIGDTLNVIVVPIKAVVMNLLSVGAAYGMVVLVFQKGVGSSLFGFQEVPVIESWIPLFLFATLFGLSMDYHAFLLSRIKERYDQTGDNSGSVMYGLKSTASIITGAALIMVAVFGGFALGPLSMFQQMGFGLAVAVILDATIVRMVLVPASMELLGDKN